MNRQNQPNGVGIVPLFRSAPTPVDSGTIPSSSPAFSTPLHPTRAQHNPVLPTKPTILPISLPPATLRPLAFRIFTKKHNLNFNSSALQAFATFIGKHCGTGWREEGLAEGVLEEIAKTWKKNGGGLIVEGEGLNINTILQSLGRCMSGGRLLHQGVLSQQVSSTSIVGGYEQSRRGKDHPSVAGREDSQASLGLSNLEVGNDDETIQSTDPRTWLKVIGAFEQPRLVYNTAKKYFEKVGTSPSLLPNSAHKTELFRNRYNLIHQRLLRNESFQAPTITPARTASLHRSSSTIATVQQVYKLTPIANLLGRSGSSHLLLGLLTITPTGTLAMNDLTGGIALDLYRARPVPENGAWFSPGMIVLVDGVYEEEGLSAGPGLGGGGGVGGTIGGRFVGFSMGGPPCERREVTLGISGVGQAGNSTAVGGFGWVDFLGIGSERASGIQMRKLEKSILRQRAAQDRSTGRNKVVVLGEVNLDSAKTIQAIKKILGVYAVGAAAETPMLFVLIGNFIQYAAIAGGGSGGSIEYKEYFDSLASALSDYPMLLRNATFVFVPGDNDPWPSAFSAGAATALPRKGVPDLFTSRIKRAFTAANTDTDQESGKELHGEAVWTTNPARLSLFGPAHEIVLFRDDLSGRLRRNAVGFRSSNPANIKNSGEAQREEEENGGRTVEQMNVDEAVEAAESHLPAPTRGKEPANSAALAELTCARKLVKTILDQGYLAPFPLSNRPVLWDFAGALQLYPLPTALVVMDPEAPTFAITYEGCHVMNPGRLVIEGRRGLARWMEYDTESRHGKVREVMF